MSNENRQIAENLIASLFDENSKELRVDAVDFLFKSISKIQKQQDKDTRHACAEAVIERKGAINQDGKETEFIHKNIAHGIVINCQSGLSNG